MSGSEPREVNQPLAMHDPPPAADAVERRWSARKPIALDVVIYESRSQLLGHHLADYLHQRYRFRQL